MDKYIYAVWRRKTSSAQIKLFYTSWENKVNWKEISSYFSRDDLFNLIFAPFKVCNIKKEDVFFEVKITWSWISAHAQAIRHALSRALALEEKNRKFLKEAWFLTRDSRKVERKKPGKKKARKSSSWSKR